MNTGYLENDDDENEMSMIISEEDFCKLFRLKETKTTVVDRWKYSTNSKNQRVQELLYDEDNNDNKKKENNKIVNESNDIVVESNDMIKNNNNNNNDTTIEENNITISSDTKYYYYSIVKVKFEFTDDEYSTIQEIFQHELDKSNNNKKKELIILLKNVLYMNDTISSMNLFNIFLLHEHLYNDDDSINDATTININMDNNFTLSLNILYKIFYNITQEEKHNNRSSKLLLEINNNDEEELQSIFNIKNNKNKKNNINNEFNKEFIKLLKTFYTILKENNHNNITIQNKYQNIKIDFNATMLLLDELIEIKSPNLVKNDKSSKLILEIIIFFVEFYNESDEKFHVLLLEKNHDEEEEDILINIKNNYKRSWWLMTQSSKFNNKNDKFSINTIKKYFSKNSQITKCVLTFEKDYNELNFYEFDIFTIWNQLDCCFELLLDQIISQHLTKLEMISYFEEFSKKQEI